jgi:hypothetical protein
MTNRRIILLAAAALLCLPVVRAQEPSLVPRGMEALGARATLRNDFTFDKSMLDAASRMMPEEDRPIIAKLRSISVHNFRYSVAGYDPAALEAVRAEYSGHGWNHLVTKQTHPPAEAVAGTTATATTADPTAAAPTTAGPATSGSGSTVMLAKPFDPTRTDVWARMDHGNFDGVVLLVANGRTVNLVVIDGMISPLDLLHLRGHFGIPRFGGDEFVEGRQ